MSRFSVYLKNLVEESGVPHATLARAAGLNRPNLQNILSGSRKPSQKDVESLLPHLRASAAQQTELMELLEEELLAPMWWSGAPVCGPCWSGWTSPFRPRRCPGRSGPRPPAAPTAWS